MPIHKLTFSTFFLLLPPPPHPSQKNRGILFALLKWKGMLRVSEEHEMKGLDVTEHDEPSYTMDNVHKTGPAGGASTSSMRQTEMQF